MSNLEALDQKLRRLAWYKGEVELFTISLRGKFEGYTHRATEDWEHQYMLSVASILDIGFIGFTIISNHRESLNDLCGRALALLEQTDQPKENP